MTPADIFAADLSRINYQRALRDNFSVVDVVNTGSILKEEKSYPYELVHNGNHWVVKNIITGEIEVHGDNHQDIKDDFEELVDKYKKNHQTD